MKPERASAQSKARRPRRAAGEAQALAAAEPKTAAPEAAKRPPVVVTASAPPAASVAEDEISLRRQQRTIAAVGAIVGAGGFVYAGVEFGPPGVVLLMVGAALVAVIAAFWSSLRTLLGESRLSSADAFALGAPRAEEEQKRAVLRALKDLEFERSVGKISDDDYAVLVARYRDEAKRLLRQIDQASLDQRAKAEAVVQRRLERAGLSPSVDVPLPAPAATEAPSEDAAVASEDAAAPAEEPGDEPVGDAPSEEPAAEAAGDPGEAEPSKEPADEVAPTDDEPVRRPKEGAPDA